MPATAARHAALPALLALAAACGRPPEFPQEPPEDLAIRWHESLPGVGLCCRSTRVARSGRTTVETPGGHRTTLDLRPSTVESMYDLLAGSRAARMMREARPADRSPCPRWCGDATRGHALEVVMEGRRYVAGTTFDPTRGVYVEGSEAAADAVREAIRMLAQAAGLPHRRRPPPVTAPRPSSRSGIPRGRGRRRRTPPP